MNIDQIRSYLSKFCAATGCAIDEYAEHGLTVKLSQDVDRALTNRPYYWLFVERMGVEAETLRMQWLLEPAQQQGARIPTLACHFGGQGLQSIFRLANEKGKFVRLFEQPPDVTQMATPAMSRANRGYQSWLALNLKIEYCCDVKKEEIRSLAIDLQKGTLHEDFHQLILRRSLQANLPHRTYLLPDVISCEEAWQRLLAECSRYALAQDDEWATAAYSRLAEELTMNEAYFTMLMAKCEDRTVLESRFKQRQFEIESQYKPQIRISVINGGLFHLNPANSISTAV